MSEHLFFSATHASLIYAHFNRYEFNSTAPGQLLARKGIKSYKKDEKGRKLYPISSWNTLWNDMYLLHKNRAQYDETILQPQIKEAPKLNNETCYNIIISM